MTEERLGPYPNLPRRWPTFLDTPPDEVDPASAQVVVVPVPYESTVSYRSGTRYGPEAIIRASRHLEDYDPELDRDISAVGIYTAPALEPHVGSPRMMVERVRRAVAPLARAGKVVALLGGEHTITLGAVRAYLEAYPDLSVLYLDAHADLRDRYMGSAMGHACVARRLHELCPLGLLGVRSLSAEEMAYVRRESVPLVLWNTQAQRDIEAIAARVVSWLSPVVYVSVDLDVLDPSIMAAVGTPEPGGMSWAEVDLLLRAVSEQRRIVAFDLVELSPPEGPEACAFTAAKLAYRLMGYATAS